MRRSTKMGLMSVRFNFFLKRNIQNKFMKANRRIINVSSIGGGLQYHQKNVVEKFSKEGLTIEDLFKVVQDYPTKAEKQDH